MEEEGEYPHLCVCGRPFDRESALTNHRRICKKTKVRLASALWGVKEAKSRKRPRTNIDGPSPPIPSPTPIPLELPGGNPGRPTAGPLLLRADDATALIAGSHVRIWLIQTILEWRLII